MVEGIRYSAAKSSRITKRAFSISSVKKIQQNFKKNLPSQLKYLENLKEKSKIRNDKNTEEKLKLTDYNVQLDYQLPSNEDLMVAINTIIDNQWSESSSIHCKYHSIQEIHDAQSEEELLFLLKGLSMRSKADIMKYRHLLPCGIVTLSQLYSIYEHQGNTFVDKALELKIREGILRKFVITNASPIILRSPEKFQHGKITYGYENVEVIVKSDTYIQEIKNLVDKINKDIKNPLLSNNERLKINNESQALTKLLEFIKENPTALFLNGDDFDKEELTLIVKYGFATLTSNHLNEIESHHYSISFPNCGTFLKLINSGRAWVVKLLNKRKYKESLEADMFLKWEGVNFNGDSKMANFRKPFYGYDLHWILADAYGAGVIEAFNTPVGIGWKLTGKLN